MTSVLRGQPELLARLVRRDLQGRRVSWGRKDPQGRQGRLDCKVLKAPRVILVLKDLPVQRAKLDRRDLPDPWVQLG